MVSSENCIVCSGHKLWSGRRRNKHQSQTLESLWMPCQVVGVLALGSYQWFLAGSKRKPVVRFMFYKSTPAAIWTLKLWELEVEVEWQQSRLKTENKTEAFQRHNQRALVTVVNNDREGRAPLSQLIPIHPMDLRSNATLSKGNPRSKQALLWHALTEYWTSRLQHLPQFVKLYLWNKSD